jgi:penicillin-binding protein 2
MEIHPFIRRIAIVMSLAGAASFAQAPDPGELASPAPPATAPGIGRSASDGAIITRRDARTITLKIPAPRGMITARDGEPFAQNQVAYQLALQFRQFENADRSFVVNWARTRIEASQALVKNVISLTDDELFDHYRHRRWLPLLLSGQFSEKEARSLEPELGPGLVLHPVYRRHYPHGQVAAHIIGYTGSVGKMPTGPINFSEPMWEESEGRAGLEKIHDSRLNGEPGIKKMLFDEDGNQLLSEQVRRPVPGGTLVTTLDMKWQLLAEKILRDGCQRGAFVVIDVVTGEVLVMASRPSFDLNRFIPGISEDEFKALNEDPATPLFGRAFQSSYPPASAYKPIVALAALNQGVVTENSTLYCPAAITIGNHTFNNWTRSPEGSINVKRAIARSCNTWFYQVGIKLGPSTFLNLSQRLGFGERSGLPLIGENPGLVPNDEWMLKHEKRRILNGDTANMSIGQGVLLASPLQVAQAMAGIANGGALPRLQLIAQEQDIRGRVVHAPIPERRNWLGVDPKAVEIVRKGMSDTVNSGGGTGRSAALSYTRLCGKTGTAQWGPKSRNQRLAWFVGFLPEDNPRYAFAVLYEGRPNERVSGGRMAAPMVKRFFEGIKNDIKETIAPPQRALVVVAEEDPNPDPPAGDKAPAGDDTPAEAILPPKEILPAAGEPAQVLTVPTADDGLQDDLADSYGDSLEERAAGAPRAVPVDDYEALEDPSEEP